MNEICKTNDKKPTTKEITYHISGKGKGWSYEYGKLYPGRYMQDGRHTIITNSVFYKSVFYKSVDVEYIQVDRWGTMVVR